MYLHIGNGKSVKKKDIVGIFDLDTATVSGITKKFINGMQKFINGMQKKGKLEYYDTDLPRAFILLTDKKSAGVRLSRISSVGLKMRLENEGDEE